MKRILYVVLIAILLGGCAPLATADSPSIDLPSSLPTDPPASLSATGIPLVLETASDLAIGHIDPIRIVPFNLDPATNFDQVLAEYKKVMIDNLQPMNWFSGTPNGKFKFQLTLDLATETSSQVITLRYPIRVTISPTEVSAQSLNLISPAFSGGGGVTNSFPSFDLQPGTVAISPTDIFGQEMSAGQMTGILYDINSACVQTGVYNVFFQIPYDITESGVTQSKMTTYNMVLACPQEVKAWMFNPDDGTLSGTQNLVFENGQYMAKP